MRRHILVFGLFFLLLACARPKPPLPPAPVANILLEKLKVSGRKWQQLDAAAEVGFRRDGKYFSTRQFLLVEKPQRLRVDVLTFFGQLAFQLTVNQDQLQVFLNTTVPGKFYQGPARDDVLARFTRLPLRASELIRLLLYDPPRPEYLETQVTTEGDRYRLRLISGDRQQQFFFDEQLRLRRGIYLQAGQELLLVNYDDFAKEDGFPRRARIEIPQQKLSVVVSFSEVKLNQPAADKRFILTPPANALPLKLPELRPSGESS